MAEILASNIMRLLVTVGILAAVYFFAIKPILDTTNDTIDRAFAPLDGIQEEIQDSFDDAGINGFDADSIKITGDSSNKKAQRLLDCVEKAQPNTTKMQACVERFQE
jgi:hypothetical protein